MKVFDFEFSFAGKKNSISISSERPNITPFTGLSAITTVFFVFGVAALMCSCKEREGDD
jgi:hypothetical protein